MIREFLKLPPPLAVASIRAQVALLTANMLLREVWRRRLVQLLSDRAAELEGAAQHVAGVALRNAIRPSHELERPVQPECPVCQGPTLFACEDAEAAKHCTPAEHCMRCGWHEADERRRAEIEGAETNR